MKSKYFQLAFFVLLSPFINGQISSKVNTSLRRLNNDTLLYMRKEIDEKKDLFIGRPLNELLSELPLPVVRYLNGDIPRDKSLCPSTSFHFFTYSQEQNKISQKTNPLIVVITWATPFKNKGLTDAKLGYWGGEWTQTAFDFFKDKIIGNIEMVKFEF